MRFRAGAVLLLSTSVWAWAALAQDQVVPPLGPDELNFSTGNMDMSVSPRDDFYRYVAGTWLDKTVIPPTLPEVNVFSFMGDHVTKQMATVIAKAADDAMPSLSRSRCLFQFTGSVEVPGKLSVVTFIALISIESRNSSR